VAPTNEEKKKGDCPIVNHPKEKLKKKYTKLLPWKSEIHYGKKGILPQTGRELTVYNRRKKTAVDVKKKGGKVVVCVSGGGEKKGGGGRNSYRITEKDKENKERTLF